MTPSHGPTQCNCSKPYPQKQVAFLLMPRENPFPPGSLVAFYSRDSGGDEQDLSIQRQVNEFQRWCAEHNLLPGQIFADEARPGSSVVGRAEFLRMVRHFRSGGAREAGLVVWRFSRFGRNASDRKYYKADIRRLGYTIHSLSDAIPGDRFGALIEDVLDWKDEYFLEELSEEVASGLRNIVATYGAVPGTPPRGFMRQPVNVGQRRDGSPHILHRWVPDPTMTGLVRRAFHMLVRGQTLREIHLAAGLYRSINSYTTFFRNPLYKGELRYKDLVIPDYCDPVVDPAVWERAQRILDARAGRKHTHRPELVEGRIEPVNSLHPRRVVSPWLLSGLARCARCSAPLNGHVIKKWTYYTCSAAKRRRDCDALKIPAPHLENIVTGQIRKLLDNPDALASLHGERMQAYLQTAEQLPARQKELDTRLANLRRGITNLTAAIAEHGHSPALLAQLTALEVQEYELKDEREQLHSLLKSKPVPLTPERIRSLRTRFDRVLAKGSDDEKRQLMAGWVHTLQAERDGNTIRAYLELYLPPTGPDPPDRTVVLHSEPPWGHSLVALQITEPIQRKPYKKRGNSL